MSADNNIKEVIYWYYNEGYCVAPNYSQNDNNKYSYFFVTLTLSSDWVIIRNR